MEGAMLGVLPVDSTNINFQIPTSLLVALDRYRTTLTNRPSRSFLIRQFIEECLRMRGVDIPPTEETDAGDI
jgi:hypothetical protein